MALTLADLKPAWDVKESPSDRRMCYYSMGPARKKLQTFLRGASLSAQERRTAGGLQMWSATNLKTVRKRVESSGPLTDDRNAWLVGEMVRREYPACYYLACIVGGEELINSDFGWYAFLSKNKAADAVVSDFVDACEKAIRRQKVSAKSKRSTSWEVVKADWRQAESSYKAKYQALRSKGLHLKNHFFGLAEALKAEWEKVPNPLTPLLEEERKPVDAYATPEEMAVFHEGLGLGLETWQVMRARLEPRAEERRRDAVALIETELERARASISRPPKPADVGISEEDISLLKSNLAMELPSLKSVYEAHPRATPMLVTQPLTPAEIKELDTRGWSALRPVAPEVKAEGVQGGQESQMADDFGIGSGPPSPVSPMEPMADDDQDVGPSGEDASVDISTGKSHASRARSPAQLDMVSPGTKQPSKKARKGRKKK